MNKALRQKLDEIALIIKTKSSLSDQSGLLVGNEGIILFLCYYSKFRQENKYNEGVINCLDSMIEKINLNQKNSPIYSTGLAGTSWLIQHLTSTDFIDKDTEELLYNFDELLYDSMISFLNQGMYDFLHEGLGITFYYLERNDIKCDNKVAEAIKILDSIKTIHQSGSYKWISNKLNISGTIEKVYNISLSHGMSSIVVILAKALERGIEVTLTKNLLVGTIKYILEQEQDFEQYGCCFPNIAKESIRDNNYRSRLSWCYGDLGIALALYKASKVMVDDVLTNKAIDIFLKNTTRTDLKMNGIGDATLCHGSAGIAHIFNRMFLNTKLPKFKETADYWFQKTLELAIWKDGLAGFKKRTINNQQEGWENENGFLEGIAGIGLALIANISETDPVWDKALLIS
jgi:lantibiotic biosynthesis protein